MLLKRFGSLRKLRAASVPEIAAAPGFGQQTAEAVYRALHQAADATAPTTPTAPSAPDRGEPDTALGMGAEHER
jgi:ERCC4-type nuclease